ncbi:MAG: hypothetical protein PWR24_27 [Desulfonauticus sp.]|jgi:acyl-ACP thioesterase|nr:hypothetical protein [Desulfonauticus sp.]
MYKTRFKVKIFEVDKNKKLSLLSLLNSIQQAAYEDSSQKFFSSHLLWEKGLSWVLTRLYLEIYNLPSLNEFYNISTCSVNLNKFFAKRDFLIEKENSILAKCTTLWSLLDVNRRKIASIPKEWLEKHENKKDILTFPKPKPEKQNSGYTWKEEYISRKLDFDLNQHVNNAILIALALESLPQEMEDSYLHSLDVLFFKEVAKPKEKIICKGKREKGLIQLNLEDQASTPLLAINLNLKF